MTTGNRSRSYSVLFEYYYKHVIFLLVALNCSVPTTTPVSTTTGIPTTTTATPSTTTVTPTRNDSTTTTGTPTKVLECKVTTI